MTGEWLAPELEIDHWDRDKLNNRWENLRAVTRAQNGRNLRLRVDSTSGVKGVSREKDSGKWHAKIWMDGKQHHLGSYFTVEEAAAAYKEASLRLHGEFSTFTSPVT